MFAILLGQPAGALPLSSARCNLKRLVNLRAKDNTTSGAFTRLDLLVLAGSIGLISLLAISVGANTRDRSERAVCLNNLRHIGRAFHLWAADHEGRTPCVTPYTDGGLASPPPNVVTLPNVGTFPSSVQRNAWFQFVWMYRELETPAVLACPGDAARRRAITFLNDPNGGFLSPIYQNNAVSYFLGVHPYPEFSSSILAGDRHLSGTQGGSFCSVADLNANLIRAFNVPALQWGPSIHQGVGNLLLQDGRVEEFSNSDVQKFFAQDIDCTQHLLFP